MLGNTWKTGEMGVKRGGEVVDLEEVEGGLMISLACSDRTSLLAEEQR